MKKNNIIWLTLIINSISLISVHSCNYLINIIIQFNSKTTIQKLLKK